MGEAKGELNKAGFRNIVVAGGSGITDSDKVTSAPEQGAHLALSVPVRLIATPPASEASPVPSSRSTGQSTSTGHSTTGSSGPSATCDVNAPAKFGTSSNPNEITNKNCGYTGSKGKARSHDPWIDGQLQDSQQQPSRSSPIGGSSSDGPGAESIRQYQQCLHTSGCDPSQGN